MSGRPKEVFQVGDYAFLPMSAIYEGANEIVKVQVIEIAPEGTHPIRVRTSDGDIYYCAQSDLSTRPAKAEKLGKTKKVIAVSPKIKKEAESLTKERMERIIDQMTRDSFKDIENKFFAIFEAKRLDKPEIALVIELAEKQLLRELNGNA